MKLEWWFILMDIFQLVMVIGLYFLVESRLRERKPKPVRFINKAHGRRSGKK